MEGTTLVLLSLLVVLVGYLIGKAQKAHRYWQDKGVTTVKPFPFLGNLLPVFRGKISTGELYKKFYEDYPNEKYVGTYSFLRPNLMVRDPLVWKRVAQSDFSHFTDRGFELRVDPENHVTKGLSLMKGNQWRSMRAKLSPTFTTGKIKGMFEDSMKCGLELSDFLRAEESRDQDLKSLYTFYTCSAISRTAFGVDLGLRPGSEFVRMAERIFEMTTWDMAKFVLASNCPTFKDVITVDVVPKDVSKYFTEILRKTIETRRNSKVRRNDFVSILLELKEKGSFKTNSHDPDDEFIDFKQVETAEDFEFTDEVLMAQAFLFLTAGLDSTAIALEYLTFELARNPEAQEKAREEVRRVLANEEFTYQSLAKMEFLEKCIKESQRLYPVAGVLQRECTKDIELEPGLWLQKGDLVTAPIYGYHTDPELFPEPEKFRPEFFTDQSELGAFLPFGTGPRMCIGMRFAQMNVKLAACLILDNFKILPSTKNTTPFRFDPASFLMAPLHNLWARFERIK